MTSSPARIGASFDEIDTPALVVELDPFEHNLRKLADFARKAGVRNGRVEALWPIAARGASV